MNFGQYLEFLKKEKFSSIIIYSKSHRALSKFSQQAAVKYKGKYLDLLNYFKQHSELAKGIDVFKMEDLLSLLKKEAVGQSLLFVDKMDFLLDTWRDDEKKAFYRLLQNQWNSFLEDMKAGLVICLRTNNFLENKLKIVDTKGNSRVHKLSNFKAID